MTSSPSAPVALLLLLSAVLGCSNTAGPRGAGVAGTYVLRQIGGDPLPAVAYSDENAVLTIVADTLFLRGDGTGRFGSTRLYEVATILPEYTRSSGELRYAVRRGRIEGEFICPPNALCAAPPHFTGTVGTNGLRLEYVLNLRTPFLYERIASLP